MKRLAILLILTLVAIVPQGCNLEHSGSQRVTVNPFNTDGRGMLYPTSNHRSREGEPTDYR